MDTNDDTNTVDAVTILSWLNNDCVVVLLKYLTTLQLINLFRNDNRFEELISRYILHLHQRQIDFNKIYKFCSFRCTLKLLGNFATNLKVSIHHIQYRSPNKSASSELLYCLCNYYSKNILKRLDIQLDFNEIKIHEIGEFAEYLRELRHISVTSIKAISENIHLDQLLITLLRQSQQLESIVLKGLLLSGSFLTQERTPADLSNLVCITIDHCKDIETSKLIECAKFQTLRSFTWKNSRFLGVSDIGETISRLCSILGNNFPDLQSIGMHMNYRTLYCQMNAGSNGHLMGDLLKLKQLKSLSIGCAGACSCINFIGILKQISQLKRLEIESPNFDGSLPCSPCPRLLNLNLHLVWSHLTALSYLRLVNVGKKNENILQHISKYLPNLSEMHLIGYLKLSKQRLLNFIKDTPKLCILNIETSKITFTRDLYLDIVGVCRENNRSLRIIVVVSVKTAIFKELLGDDYRKEYVQIWSENDSK